MREWIADMMKEVKFASGLYIGVALGSVFGVLVGVALTVHVIHLVK